MTSTARPWVPLGAAAHPAVRAVVEPAVEAWSARWFARRGIRLLDLVATAAAPDGEWRSYGGPLALGLPHGTMKRLLTLAFDLDEEPPSLTPTDRQVVAAFEQKVLCDLQETVERALDLPVRAADSPPAAYAARPAAGAIASLGSDRSGMLLRLAIPVEIAAAVCRAALPPPSARSGPLASRFAALGGSSVRLEATLGKAELSLSELTGILPGDVVVLDRALDAGDELTLSCAGQVVARGALTTLNGQKAAALAATATENP